MIIEFFQIIIAFIVGLGLGLFYFGGLWLTIRQLPVTENPYRLFFSSLILRLGITLFVLYLMLNGQTNLYSVLSLLACFLGFLLLRTIAIILLQPKEKKNYG
ncbi:MAG: ATP synthase subunit I [Prochloraceae cyanobacterium]|nr:ATP synthase subunit I [Prochloraceae cyanobacterium]